MKIDACSRNEISRHSKILCMEDDSKFPKQGKKQASDQTLNFIVSWLESTCLKQGKDSANQTSWQEVIGVSLTDVMPVSHQSVYVYVRACSLLYRTCQSPIPSWIYFPMIGKEGVSLEWYGEGAREKGKNRWSESHRCLAWFFSVVSGFIGKRRCDSALHICVHANVCGLYIVTSVFAE